MPFKSKMTIVSWAGQTINDGTVYEARIMPNVEGPNNYQTQAIHAQRTGKFPNYVRNQPKDKVIQVSIRILGSDPSQSTIDTLRKWFDPVYGPKYLIATDSASVSWRIQGICENLIARNETGLHWVAVIRCATPVWEANSLTSSSEEFTASGETVALTNNGNARTYPTLTLTPNTIQATADNWIRRRRVIIANRSERPFTDPVGDGWPVDLGENTLDTDALNTASKIQTDLDDLRLWLSGAEIHRWVDPVSDDATTKVWTNLQMRSRKVVTARSSMTAGSPATGSSLEVSNAEGTAGWPTKGAVLFGTELILYDGKSADGKYFLNIIRGARNTTAASHSAGDSGHWVEHLFFYMLYSYSAATSPNPPNDRKPMIDLDLSTNSYFKWATNFLNSQDRRSAAWQRSLQDSGETSNSIRCYESAGVLYFEDALAEANKPQFNNIVIDLPVPIDAAAAAIEFDHTVEMNMLLYVYGTDEDGFENKILTEPSAQAATTNEQITVAQSLTRLRFNALIGAVCGFRDWDNSSYFSNSNGSSDDRRSAKFDLDAPTIIDRVWLLLQRVGTTGDVTLQFSTYPDLLDAHTTSTNTVGHLMEWENVIPGSDISTSMAWYLVVLPTPILLEAGSWSVVIEKVDSTGTVRWAYTLGHEAYRMWNANPGTGVDPGTDLLDHTPLVLIYSSETPAQLLDSPLESGDTIALDNIELTFASASIPDIFLAPEETMFYLNGRLQNETTGDYIDLQFPMALGSTITIDCENKRIVDEETGWEIPFIASPSNPADWVYLDPGANTLSFVQTGIVSLTLGWEFRSRKLG